MVKYWQDTKCAMIKVAPKDGINSAKRARAENQPQNPGWGYWTPPPPPLQNKGEKGADGWQYGQYTPNIGPSTPHLYNIQSKGYGAQNFQQGSA
eukprot:5116799-Heterocapsa_arctica.AAC.1